MVPPLDAAFMTATVGCRWAQWSWAAAPSTPHSDALPSVGKWRNANVDATDAARGSPPKKNQSFEREDLS
jgi:hypothetical protein